MLCFKKLKKIVFLNLFKAKLGGKGLLTFTLLSFIGGDHSESQQSYALVCKHLTRYFLGFAYKSEICTSKTTPKVHGPVDLR